MPAFGHSVSIIVPTRNEAENVASLVSQIVSRPVALQEILFVDDSTDATRDVIRSLAANHPVRLIEQDPARPQPEPNEVRSRLAPTRVSGPTFIR